VNTAYAWILVIQMIGTPNETWNGHVTNGVFLSETACKGAAAADNARAGLYVPTPGKLWEFCQIAQVRG
jgi:hypothetical protein